MKRKFHSQEIRDEKRDIIRAGYVLWEEKPWHWVVTQFHDDKVKIHVWPTVFKYMVDHDYESSLYQNDLIECLKKAFDGARPPTLTNEQKEAQEKVQELRNSFL